MGNAEESWLAPSQDFARANWQVGARQLGSWLVKPRRTNGMYKVGSHQVKTLRTPIGKLARANWELACETKEDKWNVQSWLAPSQDLARAKSGALHNKRHRGRFACGSGVWA